MSKLPLEGRSAASSGASLGKNVVRTLEFYTGVQGAHLLGSLPLWGREGVTLVNRKNLMCQIGFYPAATE